MGRQGPLSSLRIIEFAGIGPAPFAAMMLADLGADMIRIDRPGGYPALDPSLDLESLGAAGIVNRNRPMVRVDLKSASGRALVQKLAVRADALLEGYRPGTMEKLGLGPEVLQGLNPRLVFARMTGWGQGGPLAARAGHDINYIGLSGALSLFGAGDAPPKAVPPLVGDMGGGGMLVALGLLAAVVDARASGRGAVVDAAIVDGSASLYALLMGLNAGGGHGLEAGANVLDGGRHFYRTYCCADGKYVAVGAIEPQFRALLLGMLGLAEDARFTSGDVADEPYCQQRLAEVFSSKDRDDWAAFFAGSDACVTPVLAMDEAPHHPHAQARGAFMAVDGVMQAAPAPRFSSGNGTCALSPREASRSRPEALTAWGITQEEQAALRAEGVLQ